MFQFFKKQSAGQEITLKLSGMHCASCAMNIDGALEDTDGVIESNTSYAASEVKVQFNPEKITLEQIIHIIVETGYNVEQKKAVTRK